VSVLALTPAHEAVLIHQYRHGVGRVVLELPAGSMDAGEDPAQAAARELMEETGYRAEEVAVLGSAYANPASQTNVSWCCLALGARPAGPATPELGEDIEVERRDVLRVFRDVEEGAMSLQATHVTTVHLAAAFLRRTERADLSGLRARLRAYLVDQE
jgi:8-oxo-dGTP pyrophosphatase MutT (NUDIX family)